LVQRRDVEWGFYIHFILGVTTVSSRVLQIHSLTLHLKAWNTIFNFLGKLPIYFSFLFRWCLLKFY